jgi:hypothetical protein
MRRALATRHLVPSEHGAELSMLHDRVAGHIGDSTATTRVVDGIPLTLEDIGWLAAMRGGWQLSLRFADPTDELP